MAENKQRWSPQQMAWSALVAVVVWSGLGFSWFGYGFNWMTTGNANQLINAAVAENFAEICVAQARSAPDAEVTLKEFSELSGYKQSSFVETSGWATMPGSDSTKSGVATLCANKLREI